MGAEPFKISLEAARVNANMTQKEASKALNISNTTLGHWENGKTSPSFAQACMLSDLYHVPIDNLFLPTKST